jgi:glycosyltransferase involved in cell wall biosynthesis
VRIAHVTATFPPHYSGTGIVCCHQALGLAQLGHTVAVFTADYSLGDADDPAKIAVHRLPVLFRFGNAPFLPGLLSLAPFDVLHLHYPFYFGSEMVFLRSLVTNLRYVVTYHQDVLFAGRLHVLDRLHHRLLGGRIISRASKVLASSWDYARASRIGSLLQTRPGSVDVLANGVDAQRFHPDVDGSRLRAKYAKPGGRVVLFVAALDRAHYFKGLAILLQALARLQDRDIHLLVVGDGDLRPRYEQQATRWGLGEQVTFCGRVSDEALPAYYACSDLLVLPSITMGEAFGLVLLEAMASGRPVVASNLPGVRSVVNDGEDGLLIEPGDVGDLADKMRTLLDDAQRRREMGERGRNKVEARYDWPQIIPRLAQVYERVLGHGNTTG